jgi:uncharacterized membrane protein YczE
VLTGSCLYCTQQLHPLVIQWKRLRILLTLAVVVAVSSGVFLKLSNHFDTVLTKLFIALICFAIGWWLLPIHTLRDSHT